MKFVASTNSSNFLVAELAAVIEELYPENLERYANEYYAHPKIKKIRDIVGDHMLNYNAYIKPWQLFLKNLPKGYKSKIHNSGFAHEIAYSGRLTLEKYEDDAMFREKAIVFNVSWLTDYYTVYGIDETFIKDKGHELRMSYRAVNVVTVSPYKEFEDGFNYLMRAIMVEFPTHKFVPFRICQFLIENNQSLEQVGDNCTVYNSLFNNSLDLVTPGFLRGDTSYGIGPSSATVTLGAPPEL